jgi:hypothetical protein
MVRIAGVRSQARPESAPAGDQQSLGDLVALATKDVSQLIRYEIDLAKTELRSDIMRGAMAGALFGFAAFVACLVLVLLSFALAFGLRAAGVPGGGGLYVCFVYAAVILVLLAFVLAVAAWLGLRRFKKTPKMRQTRKTVTDDIGMLRRREGGAAGGASPDGSRAALTRDGTPAATNDRSLPR